MSGLRSVPGRRKSQKPTAFSVAPNIALKGTCSCVREEMLGLVMSSIEQDLRAAAVPRPQMAGERVSARVETLRDPALSDSAETCLQDCRVKWNRYEIETPALGVGDRPWALSECWWGRYSRYRLYNQSLNSGFR